MTTKNKYYDLIDLGWFSAELMCRFDSAAVGITIGPNSFTGGKMNNLCIYVDLLFWTLELELRRETPLA